MYWYERFLLPVQGLLFNLFFAGAAVSLHFWGLPAAFETVGADMLPTILGIAIIVGLLLEPFALRVKFRETLRDIDGGILGDRDEDTGERSLGMVLSWFGHLVAGAILVLVALQALGFGPRRNTLVFVIAATLLVLREMYILGLIIVPPDRDRRTSGLRIFGSDLVLVLLAVASYSAAWLIVRWRADQRARDFDFNWFGAIVEGVATALLFALLIHALRFGFLVEEGIALRRRAMRLAVRISLVVAVACAMLPFFRI